MSLLRTVVSALCIVVGAALIASWAVSSVVVRAVEDGTALRGIAERAMDSREVRGAVADQITDQVLTDLSGTGFDAARPLLEGAITIAMEAAVSSEGFREVILDQVDDAHSQFADQLTDSLREPAPLVLQVDVSDLVNERLGEVNIVGDRAPSVSVPPIQVEVLSADTFEQTRDAYSRVEWAAAWGLWTGIGLLALGILVSQRKRWFLAKVLFVLGAICLAIGGSIALLGPDTLTTFIPGGADGALGTLWEQVLTEEAAPVVMERSLWIAAAAFIGALVVTLLGALVGGRRR